MKLLVIVLLICFQNSFAIISDTLGPNQTLQDNNQTLISAGETFEFGFFSPRNSNRRYVGIWFKNVPEITVVWVANRDTPLADLSPSGHVLTITQTGNIVILSNSSVVPIWSSNSTAKDPTLQLLETGNLVVKDGNSENYAWESFNYPCDTQLAGLKLGWDLKSRREWRLSSWNSLEDPSTGSYTYEIDPLLPQLIQRKGSVIQFRSGPWDGARFGGDPPLSGNPLFQPIFIFNETHVYYTFANTDNSTATRFWVNPFGSIQHQRWIPGTGEWLTIFTVQKDECDAYARCGPNGICNVGANPVCGCPTGYAPKAPADWTRFDWTGGCELRTRVNCSAGVGFRKFPHLKLPYSSDFTVNHTVKRKEDCEMICRSNCSCAAYSVAGVNFCVTWFGNLLDMRVYNDGGQTLYIKMAASELGNVFYIPVRYLSLLLHLITYFSQSYFVLKHMY